MPHNNRMIEAIRKMKSLVLILMSFSFVQFAAGTAGAEGLTLKEREMMALRIKEGAGIHVVSYEKETETYTVRIEGESDVGPNVTTPEWLLGGIAGDLSLETVKRNPNSLVGSYFRLKKKLWLLSEDEVEARRHSDSARKPSLKKQPQRANNKVAN